LNLVASVPSQVPEKQLLDVVIVAFRVLPMHSAVLIIWWLPASLEYALCSRQSTDGLERNPIRLKLVHMKSVKCWDTYV